MKSFDFMKNASHSTGLGKAAFAVAVLTAAAVPCVQAVTVVDTQTASIAPTGTFDLKNNGLIVRNTPFATVSGYVTTGFAGGAWNGFGINSSIAAVGDVPTAIAIVNNADYGVTTFFGLSVPSGTESLGRYTWYGDANLDGKVDLSDYAFTDAGFFGGGNNWLLGDYNYSGSVTLDDYAFQDAGFFGQGAPLTPSFADSGKGSGNVVPEPGSVGLLMVGALGLLNRRRIR